MKMIKKKSLAEAKGMHRDSPGIKPVSELDMTNQMDLSHYYTAYQLSFLAVETYKIDTALADIHRMLAGGQLHGLYAYPHGIEDFNLGFFIQFDEELSLAWVRIDAGVEVGYNPGVVDTAVVVVTITIVNSDNVSFYTGRNLEFPFVDTSDTDKVELGGDAISNVVSIADEGA